MMPEQLYDWRTYSSAHSPWFTVNFLQNFWDQILGEKKDYSAEF